MTHVVGIGASAGGLAALRAFFGALPGETGYAFVVIMHLSPEHDSHLAELLKDEAGMPVTQVTGEVEIKPDHVYVISPNKRLVATDTTLASADFEKPRGHRMAIDDFFRSLAGAHQGDAPVDDDRGDGEQGDDEEGGDGDYGDGIGIILSGGGSDGSVGIRAIKEVGGLVMVQDPDEAEHDAMPRNAIATGVADVVLPVRELAQRLVEFAEHPVHLATHAEDLEGDDDVIVHKILTRLRARVGHDFSRYKRSTVLRRIQRRMQVNRNESLQDYLTHLRNGDGEAEALFTDLLISVTTFFRDPESFEALAEEVIPKLFERKEGGDSIRVWCVGCSTGEEAYSVAMLLLEHAATLDFRPQIQVFASDLGEDSLGNARSGLYPLAIEADVSQERLRQFFDQEGDHYRVRRELREAVLFASHSVLKDPPFSRLDLITCRNVLIYMQRSLQEQIFDIFHYALQPSGYLFLGNAETAEGASDSFSAVEKKHRIYRVRERAGGVQLPALPGAGGRAEQGEKSTARQSTEPTEATEHRRMLEDYAPPSLLVNEGRQVLHLSERAGRYLQHPGGRVTTEVMELVRRELRNELRSALYQALERGKATVGGAPVHVPIEGESRLVRLDVHPRSRPADPDGGEGQESPAQGKEVERLALVIFNEREASASEKAADRAARAPVQGDPAVHKLENELKRSRERLHATLEEHETSQEEMKATNEELLSINEEYKSTAEELETSKEELQSVNEELETVNQELENRVDEITRANSDLRNLIDATDIGTLFLSRELRIRVCTPKAERLFNIVAGDRGRPVTHLANKLDYAALEQDAEEVLSELTVIEREVRDGEGRRHLMRIRPYRTVDDKIDGVVLTFVDIDELKQAEERLRSAKVYAERIIDTVREGLLVLDEELCIESANDSFYELFHVDPDETEGRHIYELGSGQWDIPRLREMLEDILPENETVTDFEVTHDFEGIGERTMVLNARRLAEESLIVLAIDDITEQKQGERDIETLNRSLEERVEERTGQVRELASKLTMAEQKERRAMSQVLHDDLQQLLYGVQLKASFVQRDAASGDHAKLEEHAGKVQDLIGRAIETTRKLTVDLSPPVLEGEGLVETLGWLVTQMKELHHLTVELRAEDPFRIPDKDIRVLLFQILRELLFNIVKHAETDDALIELQWAGDNPAGNNLAEDLPEEARGERNDLIVHVIDEGIGFDVEAALARQEHEGGFGLFSVRERLGLFGGGMEIDSTEGEGTRVTIHMPVASDVEEPSSAS